MAPHYQMIPTYGIGVTVGGSGWAYDQLATFRFLDLPPEIRNQIYDLVVPSCRILILGNHPQREINKHKQNYSCRRSPPKPYRLRSILLSDTSPLDLAAAIACLKVCRKFNQEVTSMLYSRTTFRFGAIKHINKFLNIIPPHGRKDIACLELSYSAYGEPQWTKDEYWKKKSDWKWLRVCQRLQRELPALEQVDLDIRVADWPIQLRSSNYCFMPLEMLAGAGLGRVRITLKHYRFHSKRCESVARALENMMMTPEGIKMRDMEEAIEAVSQMREQQARTAAQRALLHPIRAKKALIIKTIPSAEAKSQTANQNVNTRSRSSQKPVYRTKGLEGWARVNLDTVGVTWIGPQQLSIGRTGS